MKAVHYHIASRLSKNEKGRTFHCASRCGQIQTGDQISNDLRFVTCQKCLKETNVVRLQIFENGQLKVGSNA